MIRLTESLKQWLFDNHPKLLPLIMLGHTELFTLQMKNDYIAWCRTDEGKEYLIGGSKYKAPN